MVVSHMTMDYPSDADGDALRRVASDGNDMSQPMDIEFSVIVPDRLSAERVVSTSAEHGYAASLYHDDEDDRWTVYCTKRMLASYDGVVRAQAELDRLSSPFGGCCDGWGTFGNAAPS